MAKKEYFCSEMNKSEEREFEILTSKLHAAEAEKRASRAKQNRLAEDYARSEQEKADLQKQLNEKMDKLSAMMMQMTQFMMGDGNITLSESLRDSVISGVREEFRRREEEEKIRHAREIEEMSKKHALAMAALKSKYSAKEDNDDSDETSHGNSRESEVSTETQLKVAQQRVSNLQETAYGQSTECSMWHHGQQPVDADASDLNGVDVLPDEQVVEIARRIRNHHSGKDEKKPRRPQPLFDSIEDKDVEIVQPTNLPKDKNLTCIGCVEKKRIVYVKGYFKAFKRKLMRYMDADGVIYDTYANYKPNEMGRTLVDESVIAVVLHKHFVENVTVAEIYRWLLSCGLNFSESTVDHWIEIGAEAFAPLDEVMHHEILTSGNMHSDETTLSICDKRLPDIGEKEEDIPDDRHFFKRWMFCHHSPEKKLTQFVVHKRGRRTREALLSYTEFEDIVGRLWLHSDGAPLYKCYDVGELIIRVSCAVHIRRPFMKQEGDDVAKWIVDKFDDLFREERNINKLTSDPEEKKRYRVLRIGPILHEIKNKLDQLVVELEKDAEPELLKAVKYALKEYPCLLHCLEDGTLDFSNNAAERQIRIIAAYRKACMFVGSPDSAVRFARMESLVASCRLNKVYPFEFFKDVLARIKRTAKECLNELLPNAWTPALTIVQ